MADRDREEDGEGKEEEAPLHPGDEAPLHPGEGAPPPAGDLPDVPPPPYPGPPGDYSGGAGGAAPPYPGPEGVPPYPIDGHQGMQYPEGMMPMPYPPKLDSEGTAMYYHPGYQYPPPGYATQYPPPPGPYPGYTQGPGRYPGQQGTVIITTQPVGGAGAARGLVLRDSKPETHLLLSIFTCLCCSPIFGLIAICFAVAADSAYAVGDVVGARRNARTALVVCVVGIVLTFMLFGMQLMLRMSAVHH